MNLVVCELSRNITKEVIQNWIFNYELSNFDLKPILYTDNFTKDIDLCWPYRVVSKSLRNAVVLPTIKRQYFNDVN